MDNFNKNTESPEGRSADASCDRAGNPANAIEKMSILKLLLLTLATGGIYVPLWFLKRRETLNSFSSPLKLNEGIFSFIIAGCIVNLAILFVAIFAEGSVTGALKENLLKTSDVLGLVLQVVLLIQALKVRRIFIDHFDRKDISFSWPGTFFFGIFYIQYKINRL